MQDETLIEAAGDYQLYGSGLAIEIYVCCVVCHYLYGFRANESELERETSFCKIEIRDMRGISVIKLFILAIIIYDNFPMWPE